MPEAQKLARPSNAKMKMKYIPIGMRDYALAMATLPGAALQMGCTSGVASWHAMAATFRGAEARECENPCQGKGLFADRRRLSPIVQVEDRGVEPLTSSMPC